jgi:hypothetical protein
LEADTGLLQVVLAIENGLVAFVCVVFTIKGAVPLFITRRTAGGTVVPSTIGGKVRLVWNRDTTGALPRPEIVAAFAAIGASEAIVTVALANPIAVGVKV